MKRIVCIIAALTFCTLKTKAQFNDSTLYHINYTSTGNLSKTNGGDAFLLNNALGFNIKKKEIELNFGSKYVYGQQNSTLINNDFNGALDFNLYKTLPHFYYWGLAGYTSSFSLKVNNQMQAGGGIAYDIFDRVNTKLNISDGLLYEYNDVLVDDTVQNIYSIIRNSLRLEASITIKETIKIETSNFLQNSLADGDDYIIKSNTKISFRVRKWLSFTTGLTYNKFSVTEKENLLFTYGLTIDKYF